MELGFLRSVARHAFVSLQIELLNSINSDLIVCRVLNERQKHKSATTIAHLNQLLQIFI